MFKIILGLLTLLSALCFYGAVYAVPLKIEIFGSYNNGCIRGAKAFEEGTGYQIQKWGPGRSYAHPDTIDYVHKLVAKAKKAGLPDLLIGDMSKRYGGPFGNGSSHGSHQIGLDVDISFDFATPKKTEYQLANPKDVYIVDTKQHRTANFSSDHVGLLYLAAQDSRVERIFVAPGIKRELCNLYKGQDTKWLRKLRPWFGHRGHFHVRLACPSDSPFCKHQKAVPEGDGCGEELQSWFKPPKPSDHTKPVKPPKKILPEQCNLVLQGK